MRRLWLILGAVAVLAIAAVAYLLFLAPGTERVATGSGGAAPETAAATGASELLPDDRILGDPDAPVTIIEYASLTCPHCASFHNRTLPELKARYIDTGKVRLVYRDFPLDGVALRAAMLAECAPGGRYFSFLEVLFRSQEQWATADDPVAALAQIGRTAGLDEATVERCLADEAKAEAIVAQRQHGADTYQVNSTPTFIVNGRRLSGTQTVEAFEAILKDLVPES